MATTFRPYGLIRTPLQQALYRRAHIANIYASLDNPKESETVALMENVLYRNIFSDDNFTVNSQQPPTSNSRRRCDIVVRYLEQGGDDIKTLCFAECKRTNVSQAYNLERLELQAWEYCTEYLRSLNQTDTTQYVFAATMAGAHVRLWRCDRAKDKKTVVRWDGWWSLWQTEGKESSVGDWEEYWDIGDERYGTELERHFSYITRYPPTVHAGQTASTYGETYRTPLASGTRPGPAGPSSAGFTPPYDMTTSTPSDVLASTHRGGESSYTGPHMEWDPSGGQSGGISESSYAPPEKSLVLGSSESQRLVVSVKRQPPMTSKDDFIFRDSSGEKKITKAKDWKPTTHDGKAAMRHRKGDITYVSFDNIN